MSGIGLCAAKLVNKCIVRLRGPDSFPYLQLFLTNDIRHLIGEERKHCLYAHLINSNGRTLVDLFVYKPFTEPLNRSLSRNLVLAPFHVDDFGTGGHETDELLIECPSKLASSLQRLLFAMKIRKKVTIEKHDMDIWSVYPGDVASFDHSLSGLREVSSPDFVLSRDPRLPCLGYRILSRLPCGTIQQLSNLLSLCDLVQQSVPQYTSFLHSVGVGEGQKDHPHGAAFPMECNADFLNGMSFMKGMHAGDWLTGRNVRRGIRDRLMPVTLLNYGKDANAVLPPGSPLRLLSGKEVGVIRSMSGKNGLAVMQWKQLARADRTGTGALQVVHAMSGCRLETRIPVWWQSGVSGLPAGHPGLFPVPAN